MVNLDYICMETGQEIGKNGDKAILQKAIGVLQEDGVYAMFLWLEDKDKSKLRELINMLKREGLKKYLLNNSDGFPDDFSEFCEKLKEVAKDIDKLLFMKKILERTLIYALYHAKIGEG